MPRDRVRLDSAFRFVLCFMFHRRLVDLSFFYQGPLIPWPAVLSGLPVFLSSYHLTLYVPCGRLKAVAQRLRLWMGGMLIDVQIR
jgi:hypothetical protein